MDSKIALDELQPLLEDKVSRSDLQYAIANKVSVEELSRVLENKANSHEMNVQLQSLDHKVEDTYSELLKKVQNCALQKDFNYISSVLEKKANLEEVNESLQSKANKTSVANALQRKVNRQDLDSLLEAKADVADLENILSIIEAKAEAVQLDELARQVQLSGSKVDRSEFNRLADQVAAKSSREEVDSIFSSLQLAKSDQEKRLLSLETEFDSSVGELQRDMEDVKQQVVSSLGKKADVSLLERLREQTLKKVDQDYMQSQMIKLKQDSATQIELAINEAKYQRRAHDFVAFEDLAKKASASAERALDEVSFFKEQLRALLMRAPDHAPPSKAALQYPQSTPLLALHRALHTLHLGVERLRTLKDCHHGSRSAHVTGNSARRREVHRDHGDLAVGAADRMRVDMDRTRVGRVRRRHRRRSRLHHERHDRTERSEQRRVDTRGRVVVE